MPLKVLNINQAVRGQFLANPSGYGTRPCSTRESTIGFFSATDGTRLYCQGWGSGEPVVLTHTWLLHSQMWEYRFHALVEAGLRCAGHDRRGHGRSDAPGGGYDYDTLAGDLAVLLETLDQRGVTLAGHSMGGGEIVRYLSRRGRERVARIALIAAPLPGLCATPDNPGAMDPLTYQASSTRYGPTGRGFTPPGDRCTSPPIWATGSPPRPSARCWSRHTSPPGPGCSPPARSRELAPPSPPRPLWLWPPPPSPKASPGIVRWASTPQ